MSCGCKEKQIRGNGKRELCRICGDLDGDDI